MSGPARPPGTGRPSNPFAVEHVQPGAVTFLGPGGDEAGGTRVLEAIEGELARRGGHGAGVILGPHGTGKTTLLVHLVRRAEAAGRTARLLRPDRAAQDGRAALAVLRLLATARPRVGERLAVDLGGAGGSVARGLRRTSARTLARRARCVGAELVVAAHADVGLPVVHRRVVTVAEARAVIEGRLDAAIGAGASEGSAGHPPAPPPEAWIARGLERHHGSLRELLFELYDHWERGWPTDAWEPGDAA